MFKIEINKFELAVVGTVGPIREEFIMGMDIWEGGEED